MKALLSLSLILLASCGWSCVTPTKAQLVLFFEGESSWTEVKDEKSFDMAKQRPVFLNVNFQNTKATQISWGTNVVKGSDIQLCWVNKQKTKLRIRKVFFALTLIKVQSGLMKSWIPIDGDLFYRKDREVIRRPPDRGLAEGTI